MAILPVDSSDEIERAAASESKPTAEIVLRVRDLEKTVPAGQALFSLSIDRFQVVAGVVAGVLGPPLSGKSEFLALLAGDEQPGRGTVELLGRDLREWPVMQRRLLISRLFADDGLYERMSVRDNLELFARLFALPHMGEAVQGIARQMGLDDRLNARVEKLPEALRRRVAVSRALLAPARLLLFDEPDLRADLDTHRLIAAQLLERAAGPNQAAVVVTSEDPAWLDSFCHVVYELQGGRIAQRYVPREEEKATPAIKTFKIPARKEDRIVLYNPADILYAYSKDGRTYIRTAGDEAVCNLTLQELEQRLIPSGFFKAHRSYLVNLQHVVEVQPYTRNSFTIILNDAERTALPLSKQSKEELQQLFGF